MSTANENLIVGGGKNVFEDLGIPMTPVELFKVDLAAFLSSVIQAKGMTQTQAAKALGIDQPKVSKLLRGRLDDFSIERLLGFVLAMGHTVDVAIGSNAKTRRRIRLAA